MQAERHLTTSVNRCREKKRYATERDALDAVKRTKRLPGRPARLRPYLCNAGTGYHWHLSSQETRR